jgi:hypothetical protein
VAHDVVPVVPGLDDHGCMLGVWSGLSRGIFFGERKAQGASTLGFPGGMDLESASICHHLSRFDTNFLSYTCYFIGK